MSNFNSSTAVNSNQLYEEVPICIFSLELCMSSVHQIILRTECNFIGKGETKTK